MDSIISITEDLFWIGNNDRTTDLFESLWPLPRGVSYNAYLLVDEKRVLIDTVKSNSIDTYIEKVDYLVQKYGKVDYLIINHMEPDHSGAISVLRTIWPEIKIIGNKKTAEFLKEFYGITENILFIEDGEELSIGKHRLKFFFTPMVHWPETMMTYEVTRQMLFSGDAFGGFGALNGGIFDDEVDLAYYEDEILRYFSNIVGKYSPMVQKAIQKLAPFQIRLIASTHGPVWRSDPREIINLYDKWSRHEAEEGVVLAYGSMYGNTAKMMEAVARGLNSEKLATIRIHNVSGVHLSYLIRDAWKYKAVIFASPTYDTSLFPPMDHFVRMLERKSLKNRIMGIVGTYGWSGGGIKVLEELAEKHNWRLLDPTILAKCSPKEEDLRECFELGRKCVCRMKEEK